jgi:hypothetical protein
MNLVLLIELSRSMVAIFIDEVLSGSGALSGNPMNWLEAVAQGKVKTSSASVDDRVTILAFVQDGETEVSL